MKKVQLIDGQEKRSRLKLTAVTLPDRSRLLIDGEARERGVSRSEIIRRLIDEHFDRREAA